MTHRNTHTKIKTRAQAAERRDDTIKSPPPAEPAPKTREQTKPMSDDEMMAMAKQQSKERADLLKKHGAARHSAKSDTEHAALRDNQTKERFALNQKQAEERAKKDPHGLMMPAYKGLEWQEAVAALHDELSAAAAEHHFEVGELHTFGLGFDVFDPITNTVMSPARPHRRDVGAIGILLSAPAVISDITTARQHLKQEGPSVSAADKVMA